MKKFMALMLAMLTLLVCFAGCGNPDQPDTPTVEEPNTLGDGITYDSNTYLPIVKTPITLEALLSDNGTVGKYEERTLWTEMAEKTGITVKLRCVVNGGDGEQAALVFMSRNYPDMSFRIDCPNHQDYKNEAASKGDIIELTNDILAQWAPNWYKIFQENPEIYSLSIHPDGKLYGLPQLDMDEASINLRDMQYVNKEWLDELGLDVPKTLDEFTNYLRAVKNSAGVGSIPANVVPLYVREWTNLGGWWSFLDMAGVYNGFNGDIVVNNETVVCNYLDPNVKLAVDYMTQLYSEGLVQDKSFVNYDQYILAIDESHTAKTPWFIGSYFGYWNCDHEFLEYVEPMSFGEDIPVYVRPTGIGTRLMMDNFYIFSSCKYPYAALRLMDTYATVEGTLRMGKGEVGYVYLQNEDGTYTTREDYVYGEDWSKFGLANYGPGFLNADIVEQLAGEEAKDGFSRSWAYYNIYKKYVPEDRIQFPAGALLYLTSDEQAEVTTIYNNLNNYVRRYFFQVIKGAKDLDDTYDAYLTQLEKMGINRYIELKQKAWDAYKANQITAE